jgi:hypothetical protein
MSLSLNMKELNPGILFHWPSNDDTEEHGIRIRSLNNAKSKEFIKEATLIDTEYEGAKPVKKETFDSDIYNSLMYDYCIVSWTGIIDENTGEYLPCTRENKIKLMEEHPAIASMVNTAIAICASERAIKDEGELKNFFRS